MYYPIGWPRVLDGRGATGGAPIQLARHRTKHLLFELRGHSLAVWNTRLHVLLTSYKLSPGNITKHGTNCNMVVKPDGSRLAVSTSNGLVYFLQVTYTPATSSKWRYSHREHGVFRHTPGLETLSEGSPLELVSLKLVHEITLPGHTHSLKAVAGQIMISTDQSVIHRVSWHGRIDNDKSINVNVLLFANNHQTKAQPLDKTESVVDISYSPDLHGLAVVLSSGKVAFVTGKTAKFEPQLLQGVWLKETADGVCVAVNPRYNLVACGRVNGLVDTYVNDEAYDTWNKVNTLQLSKLHFADSDQYQLGPVQCLQWSQLDYCVLAVAWTNGGLSMWSVFGSLLFHSLGNQPGTPTPLFRSQSTLLQSLTWSTDGYQLWLLPRGEQLLDYTSYNDNQQNQENPNEKNNKVLIAGSHLVVMNFVKSAFVNNPILSNHEYLILHSSDRIYLGPLSCLNKIKGSTNGFYGNNICELNKLEGIPQWKITQLPSTYLALNWPIQYVAVSSSGEHVAASGKCGLAIYFINRRRWKLFGSELQEQSIVCRGGLVWFKEVIIFPCRINEKNEEIHFYSMHQNLDMSKSLHTLQLQSPPVKLNVLGPHLLVACRDSTLTLYRMSLSHNQDRTPHLEVVKLHVMSFLPSLTRPWALTLISIVPSTIRTEPGTGSMDKLESILLNIGGRVLMVQKESIHSVNEVGQNWSFSNPVSLAPSVEAVWTPPTNPTPPRSHLMESLWLACGSQGIKVWLPLYPLDEGQPTFLSKRIMLTLPFSFPQIILFSESIIVDVSHEPLHADHTLTTPLYFPPTTVRRITRLFLNHILRQLLKRNLGNHALLIARRHAHLSYFGHILELMLHEILEEEAPGSIPIPDALLPSVIEFIKQFPHFYETVGSCARKTEVALWHYLFAAVGNPKDLFEVCLTNGKLKTAATYLIIIQNLEPPVISRHLATRLLDAALDKGNWELSTDLVRFLKRIGPGDITPVSPVFSLPTPSTPLVKTPKASGPVSLPVTMSAPSRNVPDLDQSVVSVTRDHLSSGSTSNIVSISGDYQDSTGKVIKRPHFSLEVDTKEDFFIELILSRHARKLLSSASLSDLGLFSAHLDFDLYQWMTKERHRAACIDNYIQVICDLHKQFNWPFPSSSTMTTPGSTHSSTRDHHMNTSSSSMQPSNEQKEDYIDPNSSWTKGGIKRSNRPPDLNIKGTGSKSQVIETVIDQQQQIEQEVIVHSSTPSKLSDIGSYSDSIVKPTLSYEQLCDTDSYVETIDDNSLWDEDVTVTNQWAALPTRTAQSEEEIRYFVDVSTKSYCIEWVVALGVLLQDVTVFIQMSQKLTDADEQITFPSQIDKRIFDGVSALNEWANINCPGYVPFITSIIPILYQWQSVISEHSVTSTEPVQPTSESDGNSPVATVTEGTDFANNDTGNPVNQVQHDNTLNATDESSNCTIT